MGAITIEKANSLFWLGRYIERVYTTTLYYTKLFDMMLDQDPNIYHAYCQKLDIPDFYENDAHFMMSYLYNETNPDSIISNLKRAYDNAIVLRDEISSDVLCYIQMGINAFSKMEESNAPVLSLQEVIDELYAFWGSLEEYLDESPAKDMILIGKYTERIDLYCRLDYQEGKLVKAHRLLDQTIQHLSSSATLPAINEIEKGNISDHHSLLKECYDITNCFNF